MRIFCLTLAATLSVLWPGLSAAGDYFFACAIPGGGYTLEEGDKRLELRQGDKKLDYELVRRTTIRERTGVCTTKRGEKFQWGSHSYLYEIKATTEGVTLPLMFLCEEAGSGVPAAVSDCTETVTKDRQLKPTYTDGSN